MFSRFRLSLWQLIAALLLLTASWFMAQSARLTGDGHEYLLMTQALSSHYSPAIKIQDVDYFLQLPHEELQEVGISIDTMRVLADELNKEQLDSNRIAPFGFMLGQDKQAYAIHFWFYSLLAVPFFLLAKILGLGPFAGYVFLNTSLLMLAFLYIATTMSSRRYSYILVFLLCGSSYYLTWTGPEILTSVSALICIIAAMRGRFGVAALACAIGSSQNPPLIFLLPLIGIYFFLLKKWPQLAFQNGAEKTSTSKELILCLIAQPLLAAPYLFFLIKFGVASVIAKHYTDFSLITGSRFYSLFFDLDQGMVVGLPGLLLAVVFCIAWALHAPKRNWTLLLPSFFLLTLMFVMAFSTLPATNWNAGGRVMSRYAYWLAIPLLVILFHHLHALPAKFANIMIAAVLTIQALCNFAYGFSGSRSSHLQHKWLSSWLLNHHPDWYNPEAEIMMERTLGIDGALLKQNHLRYPTQGMAQKYLRRWVDVDTHGGLCAANQYLLGSKSQIVSGGWEYLHPPYRCIAHEQLAAYGFWHFGKTEALPPNMLGQGWSGREDIGVWTDGPLAILRVPLPNKLRPNALRLAGWYYGEQWRSRVTINGKAMGNYALASDLIPLPTLDANTREIVISLELSAKSSPKSNGESGDGRLLGFFLTGLRFEGTPAP